MCKKKNCIGSPSVWALIWKRALSFTAFALILPLILFLFLLVNRVLKLIFFGGGCVLCWSKAKINSLGCPDGRCQAFEVYSYIPFSKRGPRWVWTCSAGRETKAFKNNSAPSILLQTRRRGQALELSGGDGVTHRWSTMYTPDCSEPRHMIAGWGALFGFVLA